MSTEQDHDNRAIARQAFEKCVVPSHEMTVLTDCSVRATHPGTPGSSHEFTDSVVRHLRFAKPGTGIYSFDIVTYPGHLVITGDIADGYVFARVHDMANFFVAPNPKDPLSINEGYWSEKLTNEQHGLRWEFSGRLMIDEIARRVESEGLPGIEDEPLLWPAAAAVLRRDARASHLLEEEGSALDFLEGWRFTSAETEHRPAGHYSADLGQDLYEELSLGRRHPFGLLLGLHAVSWGMSRYRQHRDALLAGTALP